MAKRHKWDWDAVALLKDWKPTPTPGNMRMGQSIRHLPSDRWMTFGAFEGDSIIALDGEVPEVIQASDCRRGWDPEVDPQEFEEELKKARKPV